MKCKFCGSEQTKDISVGYIGNDSCLKRYTTAHCSTCNTDFGYVSKTEIPKIISSEYIIPKETK